LNGPERLDINSSTKAKIFHSTYRLCDVGHDALFRPASTLSWAARRGAPAQKEK